MSIKFLKYIPLFLLFLIPSLKAESQDRIRYIYLDSRDVFDRSQDDWFFGAELANSLHVLTKPYVIEDEILFKEGDIIDDDIIYETERNLRNTGLFSDVKIDLVKVDEGVYDVYVITHDRWSTMPSVLFGTGGESTNYGLRFEELNLIGTGTYLSLEGLHRSENDIGWQGTGELIQPRLFRSDYSLDAKIMSHKYRTEQYLDLQQPYRTLDTRFSYGVQGTNNFGNEFLYLSHSKAELMPVHVRRTKAWYSMSWRKKARVFFTGLLELEDVNRGKPEFRRAYDNSGRFLLSFSSISDEYEKVNKLNYYQTEDMPLGGYGEVVMGKTFAMGAGGRNLYYIGGQAEQSVLYDKYYLYGMIKGSSAFTQGTSGYTYQEFYGLGFYRLSSSLIFAARVRQQTVWNWKPLRQLILDNDSGLRGYAVNDIQGDNRIISNFELRFFPDVKLWIFNLGGAVFFDSGTAWRQTISLGKTRWHNSAGFGIRIENAKAHGPESLFRIDFAFNFDKKRFGEIIFTSDQLFSVFGKHEYKLPEIYGLEFDTE